MGAVVEGEIVDVDAVSSVIREVWRRSGVRGKDASIGVANQKVIVRLIDLPFMERTELAGAMAKDVHFVQTYSFFGKQSPVGERVIKAMMAKYPNVKGPGDITPAVGVANAYDGLHLAALAITAAGSTDGDAVRQGFYKIDRYEGLIKTYVKPFTAQQHDAVGAGDYIWAQFIDNRILPVGLTN